jgi:ACS family hexuronate transporter-like MFS transporter
VLYVAGMLLSAGTGYLPLFLFAAISYLLGFAVVQLMLPRLGALHAAVVAEADA